MRPSHDSPANTTDQPIGDMQCDDVMLGLLGTLSEKVLKEDLVKTVVNRAE